MDINTYRIMSGYTECSETLCDVRYTCDLEEKLKDSSLVTFEKMINREKSHIQDNKHAQHIVARSHYIRDEAVVDQLIHDQIKLARSASLTYRSVPMNKRIEAVKSIRTMLIEKMDLWKELTIQEGYTEAARASSLDSVLQYTSDETIERITQQLTSYSIQQDTMEYVPYGVIGFEAPANAAFPMQSQFIIGSVILAGNAAIIKPPFLSPLVGMALVCEVNKILQGLGFPDGLLSSIVFPSSKSVVNKWLGLDKHMNRLTTKSSETIDNLVFIGGSGSRDKIIATCEKGKLFNPILELEGSDVAYIDDSFNQDELAQIAYAISYAKLTAGGQYCLSLEHLIMDKDMNSDNKEYFIECLKKEFAKYRVEKLSSDFTYNISPSGKPQQIKGLIDTLKETGQLLYGGALLNHKNIPDEKGAFVQPTIIMMDQKSVPDQELFSNILIITESDGTLENVVDYINNRSFGLRSSIHSKKGNVINFLSERINSGTIIISGNHLNFRFGIAGGTGLTSSDGHSRDWALDTVRRRSVVYGGYLQKSVKEIVGSRHS